MSKIRKNNYVENMKEYEEICQYIGFGTPISIWAWDLKKFRILLLYIGLGTWKNFDLYPYIYIYGDWLWDLEKF